MSSWKRSDVELNQFWLSPEGQVCRVVAIRDAPSVTLVPMNGSHEINLVIRSPLFAQWKRLDEVGP